MKKTIAIIDYDLGNLFSVKQACDQFGYNTIVTDKIERISSADALILPGVGSFGTAMRNLNKKKLIEPLIRFANSGKPFIGICLGMQLLFSESNEFGLTKGLNILEGSIKKFPVKNDFGKINLIPQIQWNKIKKPVTSDSNFSILENINDNSYMYFVHSFYCQPKNVKNISATTFYAGIEYPSVIIDKNVIGIQFHPEKSGKSGLKIYKNLIKII